MLSKELISKIRRIQIQARRVVEDVLAGEYHSVFRGQGMEFDEVREYQAGDDIRSIDWNVTARTGKPHVKKFVEERELTVLLVVDLSGSGMFGSEKYLKNEVAAQLTALLSLAATNNNDKVGLLLFTDRIEKYVPPKKGKKHILRMIREILAFQPQSRQTNVQMALDFLNRVQKRKAVVFILSDFQDQDFENSIQITSKRHEVTAIRLSDRREIQFPDLGLIWVRDPETGETTLLDTSSSEFQKNFKATSALKRREQDHYFKSRGINHLTVNTGEKFIDPLLSYFRKRERER